MADPFAYLDCLLCAFDQRLDASDNFIVVSYHGYPTLGEIAMPTAHDPFHTNLGDWRHGSSESVRPVADTLGTDRLGTARASAVLSGVLRLGSSF